MSELIHLKLPLSLDDARALQCGDVVLLDGDAVATIGLPTHKRIVEFLEAGKPLPLDLMGSLIHLSICSRQTPAGLEPLYVNPTTSTRFEPFMPRIIRRFGVRALSGKGGLGPESVRAMKEVGSVYFSMVGGSSALLSIGVKEMVATAWDDFIEQFRLTHVRFGGFGPLTVAIDAHGNSLYDDLRSRAQARLPDIMERLRTARDAAQKA